MSDRMKLFLELGAKTQGFLRGMADSKSAVGKFVSGAKKELASLKGMATGIHGQLAGLGLTVGAGKLITDSGRLDKSLVRITQTAGEAKDKAAGLRKELFRMGRESGKQIELLQGGFDDLVQSGLDMKQSKETLKGINVAMAVTDAAAKTLAGGLTVGAKFFDFDLSKPGVALQMLDQMTVAGRLGNAELENLSSIFSRIGNNASRANMGWSGTLAFVEALSLAEKNPERLATLADSTLRVFTNLRYMAAAQKASGVKFFDSDGSRRNAFEVLADIKKRYDTLKTDMQKSSFIQAAFGKADLDTIRGIGILLEGESLTQIHQYQEQIDRATGTINKNFTDATANLIDQTGMLRNDLREAADAFVQPMNKTLSRWIQTLRKGKDQGGFGMDGKDMLLAGGVGLTGTVLAARYGPKAVKGLAGKFLKGGGSLAGGVAAGKALEAATGVTPVFVTNWPGNAGGLSNPLGNNAGGAANKNIKNYLFGAGGKKENLISRLLQSKKWLPKLAGMGGTGKLLAGSLGSTSLLTAGGGVALAGAGGYAIGTFFERLSGVLAGALSGGKHSGSGAWGEWLYDAIHGQGDGAVNKTNLTVYVDKDDRVITRTDNMNSTVDATVRRGKFGGF